MKYKELKTYQAVKFNGGQESFFNFKCKGMADIQIEEFSWGLKVSTSKDSAKISFNNVAYAKDMDAKAEAEQTELLKGLGLLKEEPAKKSVKNA